MSTRPDRLNLWSTPLLVTFGVLRGLFGPGRTLDPSPTPLQRLTHPVSPYSNTRLNSPTSSLRHKYAAIQTQTNSGSDDHPYKSFFEGRKREGSGRGLEVSWGDGVYSESTLVPWTFLPFGPLPRPLARHYWIRWKSKVPTPPAFPPTFPSFIFIVSDRKCPVNGARSKTRLVKFTYKDLRK